MRTDAADKATPRLRYLGVVTLTALLALSPQGSASTGAPEDAQKLLVVDCLLPSLIRKLGRNLSFLAARKAIKTTATDCEIRGGEYTSHDRSNYGTALKIWLPLAEGGDPQAQTYVGEIFEKGLGVRPDYTLARQWYRKAADQGYSRARINLGYIYESGLGVPRDLPTAMNWYRLASGLSDGSLEFVSSVELANREAIQQESIELRQQVEKLNRALTTRKSDLEAAQHRASQLRAELEESSHLQAATAAQLSEEQYNENIARLTRRLDQTQAEQQELVEALAKQQSDSAELRQTLDLTSEEFAAQEQDATTERAAAATTISEMNEQMQDQEAELGAREQKILELQQQAQQASSKQSLDMANASEDQLSMERALEQKNREMTAVESELSDMRAWVSTNKDNNTQTQSQMAAMEGDLQTRESDIARQQQEIVRLQTELTVMKKDLDEAGTAEVIATRSVGPGIEIIDPPISATRGVPSILLRTPIAKVELVGKAWPAEEIYSFHVNGEARKLEDNGLFRVEMPVLAPTTPVSIVVIDKEGLRSALDFEIIPSSETAVAAEERADTGDNGAAARAIDFGNYHALVIGNNRYSNMPRLSTAVNDAREVAKLLQDKYGFNTKLLIDADRYAMLSALNEMREKLTEEDNLLIYYAGHGELDRVNLRGHWLPVDAEPDSTANWISNVTVTDILNVMAAKHVLVIADSCYSGSMTRSSQARLDSGMTDSAKTEWYRIMAQARARTVLTSGGVKPVLDTGSGGHSIFARAFIDVLNENDDVMEGYRLYREVNQRVRKVAANLNAEQEPQYAPIKYAGHEAGEFFFLPKSPARAAVVAPARSLALR